MAVQLIVDLYGCDTALLNETEQVQKIAHAAIASIGAQIVEECMHQFEPVGVSYIAVITASHVSVHTWPEYGYAAIDVFSCQEGIPETLAETLGNAFHARQIRKKSVVRDLLGGIHEISDQ